MRDANRCNADEGNPFDEIGSFRRRTFVLDGFIFD
jgi:hypothetical protein